MSLALLTFLFTLFIVSQMETPVVPVSMAREDDPVEELNMTVDAVCDWAAVQGLEPGPFREFAIDGKLLLQMDHEMLQELGISSKIKRTKLLGAIADLQQSLL